VASFSPIVVHAANRPRPLSVDEARTLVSAALSPKIKHLPKFVLEQFQDRNSPQFYFFTAYWAGVPNGSMVIGNYAVDLSTDDVWNAVSECDEQSTPALRKLQRSIRAQIGLSDSEDKRIKNKGPLCH
jgi:hypothetical protein